MFAARVPRYMTCGLKLFCDKFAVLFDRKDFALSVEVVDGRHGQAASGDAESFVLDRLETFPVCRTDHG